MRMGLYFLLILIIPGLSMANPVTTDKPADYCYKPNKPLLFSKHEYQQRYKQDVKEYQKCVEYFTEVHENISSMHSESEKNARKILNNFVKQQ